MSGSAEQQECHEALVSVNNAVRGVDTRAFEAQPDTIGELLMTMKGHARAALSALDQVTERFEVSVDVDPGETLIDVQGSAASDTAFITHLHLRQRAHRLERLERSSDAWLVIGEAASLRRHIIKAMSQVERAVCAELDLEPRLEGNQERELALASRTAYQRYIRAIRTISRRIDGGELDMVSGLRLCATNIAMLFGRDVYKDLRVGDRQQLRSLQDRIFDAVRQPKDELRIRRLWMDICASAELLERIHDRVELVEHDFALIVELLEFGGSGEVLRARLQALTGRDRELDGLLAGPTTSADELRAGLVALHDRLAGGLGRPQLRPASAEPTLDNVVGFWG